jgi:hypothetical protein
MSNQDPIQHSLFSNGVPLDNDLDVSSKQRYMLNESKEKGTPYMNSINTLESPVFAKALAAELQPKVAVSYLRVSTREQAYRGGESEGFSIPAQREANRHRLPH